MSLVERWEGHSTQGDHVLTQFLWQQVSRFLPGTLEPRQYWTQQGLWNWLQLSMPWQLQEFHPSEDVQFIALPERRPAAAAACHVPPPHLRGQQHVLPASFSQPTWTCESSCFWRTSEGGSGSYPQIRCYLGRTWTPSWKDELGSAEWHTLKFQSHWRNSVMLRGSLTTSCAIGNGNLYFNFRMMQIFWIFWTQRTAKIFT